jgi:hypothetical protein
MLKAVKIELNMSKFPDNSFQNIDQVNLIVEFIRENSSIKNDNCSHNFQNISNELMFERMVMTYFNRKTSKYFKLSKI